MTIKDAIQSLSNSRYYLTAYTAAEKSSDLDDRNFGTLTEQREFFANKRAAATKSLRADLFALRSVCMAERKAAATTEDKAALDEQIAAIDQQFKK